MGAFSVDQWMPVGMVLATWALGIFGGPALQAQARPQANQQGAPEEPAERLIIVDDDTAMLKTRVAREGHQADRDREV
jgi:hypothetical protein